MNAYDVVLIVAASLTIVGGLFLIVGGLFGGSRDNQKK